VFDSIIAGPRDPEKPAALAIKGENAPAIESDDDEIVGEFDDDQIEDDLPRIQQQREQESAEICRQLDGIPLAIELAASRMASMTATEVRDRLDDRCRLLKGSRRGHRAENHWDSTGFATIPA
jgi:hypothetical protein